MMSFCLKLSKLTIILSNYKKTYRIKQSFDFVALRNIKERCIFLKMCENLEFKKAFPLRNADFLMRCRALKQKLPLNKIRQKGIVDFPKMENHFKT